MPLTATGHDALAHHAVISTKRCAVSRRADFGALSEPPPVPVHLIYPAERGAAPKVPEFMQFAAEQLRALPVLHGKGLEAPRR